MLLDLILNIPVFIIKPIYYKNIVSSILSTGE